MLSVREKARRDITRALQAAALALVERDGFAAVTVEDIAAEAGVSRRTFFNHFPTKAAALFDPDPDDADRLASLLAAADGAERLWPALQAVCESFVAGHEDVIAVRRRLIAESPELDQYHRTAHRHVEIALLNWANCQRGEDPYLAALTGQTAAAVLTTAFWAWQPDQDPAVLVTLVRRGFELVSATFDSEPSGPAIPAQPRASRG
jgi:AcrR family transcriptional regulator